MRAALLFLILVILLGCNSPSTQLHSYPIEAVNLNHVKLTDNFWLPKIKTVQNTTIAYALDKCETEGRMENFLIAGGVHEGVTHGEMPFDDTDLYKIIEGASYSLIMAPDPVLEAYIDSLISIIAIGQEEDGYLTTWKTIDPTVSPAHWAPPGERWENLATSHEMYNSGHMFEAAAAHNYATGKTNFLDIATKNADLLVQVFGPDKNPMVPGHQIIETGLIKLYQITHKEEYLKLAKHFLDARGDSTHRKLYGPYNQDHLPVVDQDEVVGHAVRAVYMYAGMTDIAALYNDKAYLKAVHKLWENMLTKKMYVSGAIGARHDGEAFGENYELPNLTAYGETCAAIGSVYWNHRLFLLTGDVKYFDVIERTLYNAVIPGISLDGKAFFYPNPLESDGIYTFNKGACTHSAWFDCSCCPTNLIRFIPSMPNLIYATAADSLYLNLFASNEANIDVNGKAVQIIQNTNYPWEGKVEITVNPKLDSKFTLKLRVPGWAKNVVAPGDLYSYVDDQKEAVVVLLNGEKVDTYGQGDYLTISREWTAGDKIVMNLPMEVKTVATHPKVLENIGTVAFEYGPLLYCVEEIDNQNTPWEVSDETTAEVAFQPELLGGVNVLKTNNELTLVPYFAWSNRGVGKMKVWLPNVLQK